MKVNITVGFCYGAQRVKFQRERNKKWEEFFTLREFFYSRVLEFPMLKGEDMSKLERK